MPTVGTTSKPAYVYDAGTDTWIPIGVGAHTHDYIDKSVITTTGDIIYASAANTPARLGIGSSGQVLTVSGGVPTWATASSGGMTLIQTLTLSGSSVTSSTLPTTYKNLYVEAIDYSASTAALLTMRPNNDSGANYTIFSVRFQSSGSNFGPSGGSGGTSMTLLDPNDIGMDTTSDGNISIANIYRYNETDTYKLCNIFNHIKNSSGVVGTTNLVATWRNTAAITSLTFGTGAGTFTGGTIKIYGVN